jgi:Alkylmercury lyase
MNLFRSEEHVAQWLESTGHEPGETIPSAKLWELAQAWWRDRLSPEWHPRTREESQAILDRLGLTGEFWLLA